MKAERTCMICGVKAPKSQLVRFVRTPSGEIKVDKTGNAAGRGAYICSIECLKNANMQKRLARTLKMRVDDSDFEAIKTELLAAL